MADVPRKCALSPGRKRLLELMQDINHGGIEDLQVSDGEPIFDPPPTVRRLFVFGKQNGPHPSSSRRDFALKGGLKEMFALFDRHKSLNIQELKVVDGLPVSMIVRERSGTQ